MSFWADLEKVLHDAVATGAGLAGNRVIWWAQNFPRPPRPFAIVKRSAPIVLGTTAARTQVYDAGAAPGSELAMHARQIVEFTFGVQLFTDDARGDSSALALAEAVRAQMTKRSQLDALQDAGLALVSRGTVQNLAALLQTDFEGRASLDMTFRVATETVESTTFIETAVVTQDLTE